MTDRKYVKNILFDLCLSSSILEQNDPEWLLMMEHGIVHYVHIKIHA
jgi:hypothetical protein